MTRSPAHRSVKAPSLPTSWARRKQPVKGHGWTIAHRALVLALFSVLLVAPPAAAAPPHTLTLAQLHHALANHRLSCTDIIRSALERIAAFDRTGPTLHAMITVNPDAMAEARDKDAHRGAALPPAHCVPVVLKDNIDTAELPTTGGSPLFVDWVPREDATVTARLRQAGAIILGKGNLDDFAAAVYGVSSLEGAMRNPYATERTVGGSSGGPATAVSAGYVPLAFGTDTGGSLRIPAAFTSVVTVRPTVGLVSRAGTMPRALTQDTPGPLGRTVADVATGLQLVAGVLPERGYAWHARHGSLHGKRIGIVRSGLSLFGEDDPGVLALLDRAAADLRRLGAAVVFLPAPDRDLLGGSSVITFEANRDMTGYLRAAGPDVPVRSFAELHASGAYTPYAKEAFDREIEVGPDGLESNVDYQQALRNRDSLREQTLDVMAHERLDAIGYASAMRPPEPIGVEQGGVFTRWSENTGFPAIGVPMGYTRSLPASLELLGRPFAEPLLFELAGAYERHTRHRVDPPL